jgi:hypothetical protein
VHALEATTAEVAQHDEEVGDSQVVTLVLCIMKMLTTKLKKWGLEGRTGKGRVEKTMEG